MPQQPQVIYLKDYQVPEFLIEKTDLRFELQADATLVKARLQIRRNPQSLSKNRALVLQGDKDLVLCRVAVNDQVLAEQDYRRSEESLSINDVPDVCIRNGNRNLSGPEYST